MEDLLVLLLQGGFEAIAMILGWTGEALLYGLNLLDLCNLLEVITDGLGSLLRTWPIMNDDTRANWICVFNFLAGLISGAISLHLCHDVFWRRSAFRLLALALGPILSGIASWIGARFWLFFNMITKPSCCFWWAFSFSLGLCLVRFSFCHRPPM